MMKGSFSSVNKPMYGGLTYLSPLHLPRMCMKHNTDVTRRNHIVGCGVRAQTERDVTERGGPQNIWSPDITVT